MPGIPAVWPSASWHRCLRRPRSRGGYVSRACGPPRGPSPGPHATCLHHLGCLKAVSSTLVSVRSLCPAVSCRSISLCVRPLPRNRCRCSRLVSGLSLSMDLRPIHPNLVQPGRLLSAASRSIHPGWHSVGSSQLASGRALTVSFGQVGRSVLPAHPPCMVSVSCFATNERIMQVGPPVGPQLRILNLIT